MICLDADGVSEFSHKSYQHLESLILEQTDQLIRNAKDQKEKAIYELFKSAVLKKYQDSFKTEVMQGEVKSETIDKYVDFAFSEACFRFRSLPIIDDKSKEEAIEYWRNLLGSLKANIADMLSKQGIAGVLNGG